MTCGLSQRGCAYNDSTYGKTMVWTNCDGSKHTVEVRGFTNYEEAENAACRIARALGWTPPRWWQWWRWRDFPRRDRGGDV